MEKKITTADKKPVTLDLTKLTGRDMLTAEQQARAAGDMTPMINLSMRYQAALAAQVMGIKLDDLMDYPANDFAAITNQVAAFLLNAK